MKVEIIMTLSKSKSVAVGTFEPEALEDENLAVAHQSSATTVQVAPKRPLTELKAAVKSSDMHTVANLKDNMAVEFNTFKQIVVDKGFFMEKGTSNNLGDELKLDLLSWQDLWVVTPKDDSADPETLMYSDDGKFDKDGNSIHGHLETLKLDYPKARIEQRLILVAGLEACAKAKHMIGKPIQINLSATSRTQFMRYMGESAYAIAKGHLTPEGAKQVYCKATVAVGRTQSQTYGLATFEAAK